MWSRNEARLFRFPARTHRQVLKRICDLPADSCARVADLIGWLSARDEVYACAFSAASRAPPSTRNMRSRRRRLRGRGKSPFSRQ